MTADRRNAHRSSRAASPDAPHRDAGAPPVHLGDVTEQEIENIETHSRLRTPVLYEIVRREGEVEMYRFTVPVLLGNIVGGTALFAVLSYAQVMKEM
ncbi:MAG: hypothetical protein ACRET0_15520 [Steroidobacteraceae bacterium]